MAKRLGEGSFGITYLAQDRKSNLVVIKTLKDERLQSEKSDYWCNRFRDEALQLALSRHPNIVQIKDDRPQTVEAWLELLDAATAPIVITPPPFSVFEFDVVTVDREEWEVKRDRTQAQLFTENLGNGVTLEMVYISGGEFIMGSPTGEGDEGEKPQHEVTVQPFFMSKFQVTQAQWKAVANLPKVKRDLKPDPSEFKGKDRPVERVSWYDAVEFCDRLFLPLLVA